MSKFLYAMGLIIILLLLMIIWMVRLGTWDDRAARKCQQHYGTYTYHPAGGQLCILKDGTVKGLLP